MAAKGARAIAAKVLNTLQSGTSGSLGNLLDDYRDREDFSLIQELCFGTCRWFPALEFLLHKLLSKPLKAKDGDVRWLLLVGLYQLRELSIADYAAINESVEASRSLKKPWAAALVNAVLRNYLRRKDDLENELLSGGSAARHAHPQWLVDAIEKQYGYIAPDIFAGNNVRPPMTLRVNLNKCSREEYQEKLAEIGLLASAGQCADTALILNEPCHVDELFGFRDGWVSVQDEASQLVPSLLELKPGQRVVDACAAPGGKTAAILEREPELASVVAIDSSARRLSRVTENLTRLDMAVSSPDASSIRSDATVRLVAAKAEELDAWWDGAPIDRLLLDAPCSATGVIRRHPDIKVLRTPEDVAHCCESQATLLQSLWPCLAEGGLLLYTTCSVLAEENQNTLENFLNSTYNAKCVRIVADWGVECVAADGRSLGRQLLPTDAKGPDGFFFALLRKITSASKSE